MYPLSRLLGLKPRTRIPEEQDKWFGDSDRETQILTLITVYLFIKYRRACSMEQFLHQAFTYCKLANVFLFYITNVRYAAYFVIFCLIVWVVSANPVYRGSNSKVIKVKSHEQYYDLLGALNNPSIT